MTCDKTLCYKGRTALFDFQWTLWLLYILSSFRPSKVALDICHNHLMGTSAEVPVIVYQAWDTEIKWSIISKSVTIIVFVLFIDQLIDNPIICTSLRRYTGNAAITKHSLPEVLTEWDIKSTYIINFVVHHEYIILTPLNPTFIQ